MELCQKGAIVARLQEKTVKISSMLMALQTQGEGRRARQARKRQSLRETYKVSDIDFNWEKHSSKQREQRRAKDDSESFVVVSDDVEQEQLTVSIDLSSCQEQEQEQKQEQVQEQEQLKVSIDLSSCQDLKGEAAGCEEIRGLVNDEAVDSEEKELNKSRADDFCDADKPSNSLQHSPPNERCASDENGEALPTINE